MNPTEYNGYTLRTFINPETGKKCYVATPIKALCYFIPIDDGEEEIALEDIKQMIDEDNEKNKR